MASEVFLLTHTAAANNISGNPISVTDSGLKRVFAGRAAARLFGVPPGDPRHPDIVGIAQHGVVYTGGKGKIAPSILKLLGLNTHALKAVRIEHTRVLPELR